MSTPFPRKPEPQAEDVPSALAFLRRFSGVDDSGLRRVMDLQRQQSLGFGAALVLSGVASQAHADAALAADPTITSLARPAAMLTMANAPFHPHSERIRSLRTEVLLRQDHAQANVLAVVSAGIGEGRSLLAAHLAVACAQLNEPTLLIDADLRCPSQHLLFAAPGRHGLGDINTIAMPQLQAVDGLPQLALLMAGTTCSYPQELLAGGRFMDCMADWRLRYRHIILDTSAASLASDSLTVAMQAGAALMLARRHHTDMAALRQITGRLRAGRVRMLGGVLQDF